MSWIGQVKMYLRYLIRLIRLIRDTVPKLVRYPGADDLRAVFWVASRHCRFPVAR